MSWTSGTLKSERVCPSDNPCTYLAILQPETFTAEGRWRTMLHKWALFFLAGLMSLCMAFCA